MDGFTGAANRVPDKTAFPKSREAISQKRFFRNDDLFCRNGFSCGDIAKPPSEKFRKADQSLNFSGEPGVKKSLRDDRDGL